MRRNLSFTAFVAACMGLALLAPWSSVAEEADVDPWYVSLSGGVIDFEGDEAVDDSGLATLRLGYDASESWSLEAALEYAPKLDESWRVDWETGRRISRLEEEAGAGVHDTYSLRLMAEALFHLTRWEKLDPFFVGGVGVAWYADDIDGRFNPMAQGGAGCFYHLNDEWALRADFRALFSASDTEANSTYTFGISWTPGARRPPPLPRPIPVKSAAAPLDSDGDGLSDAEETANFLTDPMNRDTDFDALTDGDEVRRYGTDPRKRDTDEGGVYDGHEVIEDTTDPKSKADDLQFFELRLMFDPGDWKIKSEYFSEIGVIGKILKDDPAATARIEGHSDLTAAASERKLQKLTERRAKAVSDYLTANWNIDRKRLTAAGYGSTRPKGPNDPVKGNRENERIEVYIRKASPPQAAP